MKQEPTESPASAALASRIARFSYDATPSPNGKRKAIASVEADRPSVSPHFTRLSTRGNDSAPSAVIRSPHFSGPVIAPSQPIGAEAVSTAQVDSDDDLESIDEDAGPSRGSGGRRTSGTTRQEEDEGDESDGLGGLVSDDSDESDGVERSTPSRPDQIRIRSRRAGQTERHLVSEAGSGTNPRKRQRQRQREDDDVGGEAVPKSKKKPRAYAAPEVYQHLRPLPDIMCPGLDVVFCGIKYICSFQDWFRADTSPGVRSSTTGHHFGHPTNKFWRSLHLSGMTSRLIKPEEDHLLPAEYKYGLTVLVDRPTAEQSELSTAEMRLSVLPFTEKLLETRPAVVCFVGKKIWDVYESVVSKSAKMTAPKPSMAIKEEVEEAKPVLDASQTRVSGAVEEQEMVQRGEDIKSSNTKPAAGSTATGPFTPRRRTPARPKVKFDWTKPRPFRLPHQDGYTYFWVVPNTSGLERTPLAEQIILFGHLKAFNEEVKAGQVDGSFRDVDIEGVRRTVQDLGMAAEATQVKRE